jgi:tRNA U34 2-thiouridine synthase MnmA/TrmU
MQITRDKLNNLREMQEDIASYFTEEYFPISGETYWTCVQCLAEAKLAELRGELAYEN